MMRNTERSSDTAISTDDRNQGTKRDGGESRFAFGQNWTSYAKTLNEERIREAEHSIRTLLRRDSLDGLTFLDAGCGSGLFSLAAVRMGGRVRSFDYDYDSVSCTRALREGGGGGNADWIVEQGSILDDEYCSRLGAWDIVYSWGVLHHTGNMWKAISNAAELVREDGVLAIAIYNDQGVLSSGWKLVKRFHCSSIVGKWLTRVIFVPWFAAVTAVSGVIRHGNPVSGFTRYHSRRGMSPYHDWIDWIGGYPFEVATPDEIIAFLQPRGFHLERLRTTKRLGCNELVFRRCGSFESDLYSRK